MDSFASRTTNYDFVIITEEEDDKDTQFLWSSLHLNGLSDKTRLADRASALKAIFDGAMYLAMGSAYRPFDLGRPVPLQQQTSAGYEVGNPNSNPFAPELMRHRYTGSSSFHPLRRPVGRYIALARF